MRIIKSKIYYYCIRALLFCIETVTILHEQFYKTSFIFPSELEQIGFDKPAVLLRERCTSHAFQKARLKPIKETKDSPDTEPYAIYQTAVVGFASESMRESSINCVHNLEEYFSDVCWRFPDLIVDILLSSFVFEIKDQNWNKEHFY